MKKLAVITGASSGIGLAIAQELSKSGHPLLLLARRADKIKAANLPNAIVKQVDVRDLEAFKAAVKEAEAKYGDVDLLVNNAGLMQLGQVSSQDVNEWNDMIDINMKGVFNGCHAVLEKMKSNKTGTIINISSVVGKKAVAGMSVYSATKFGVAAFSEALRQEVCQDNVRVISIFPGAVVTECHTHSTDQNYIDYTAQLYSNEDLTIQSSDIANAVSYVYGLPQNISIRDLIIAPTKQDL